MLAVTIEEALMVSHVIMRCYTKSVSNFFQGNPTTELLPLATLVECQSSDVQSNQLAGNAWGPPFFEAVF